MVINKPYLLFLGDAADRLAAKTAVGVAYWRGGDCVGQLRLPGCSGDADLGLPDVTVAEAAARGAKTLIIGVANRGGVLSEAWLPYLREALHHGMDLANGLHNRLADVPELAELAMQKACKLLDIRHPAATFGVGDGRKRSGKRLLTVGTDCSVGKMYTSLVMESELRRRGFAATFRATGQTGILIAGSGICIDAVIGDFISGAVEALTPDNETGHWDIIEGQGSLFHPSFAGVSLALLHGAQPDALVMCHEPTRAHMRGLPQYRLPDLGKCIAANEAAAHLTNPNAVCIGVSVNTAALDEAEAQKWLHDTEACIGLPCVDAVRSGAARLVDRLIG